MVVRSAVNGRVAGSSPASGANFKGVEAEVVDAPDCHSGV
jgi:hypothetical protein